jgi:hypothetical protein
MSPNTPPLLLGGAPWSDSDTISFGGLAVLLCWMLRKDWSSPIPLGTLIGLIAGLLFGFGIELVSSSGERLVSFRTRELPIVGMVGGLLIGLMGKLLSTPIPPEAKPTLPDSDQPPIS